MSTKQDQHTPNETTPLPDHSGSWSQTIQNYCNGLDYEITTIDGI